MGAQPPVLDARGHAPAGGALARALAGTALSMAAALVLLSPASAADTVGQRATDLLISEYFRCPETPHRGLLTVEPSGAVRLVVTRGLDPRRGRSTMHKKQLPPEEVEELAALVRGSGYESIPETTYDMSRERPRWKDACSRSIEITLSGRTKRIRYDSGYDNPPVLDAILRGIHAILDRHEWIDDSPASK